ncbi:putative protein YbaA [Brevundimonas subvibrioides]|uniref:RNA signal recognition particle n=1 Tax=Brevundimonas subvibrioides (strain ATCC 15264 / DSM 4735 / LMG 14903 / NBRC 16000 / CB 81) TaxID=633149 RepID=D9QND0_BRESC|nr:DUF1428 domain-containing protein [Brevundimonas subvibrioides]ADL00331.1 protein of unknown function DUF1428 [Brevundimonas subvibrioides ATCC 15264]
MPYVSGFLTPVKAQDKDRYIASAAKSWPVFQKYGCLEQVETWGVDVPPGKVTGFDLAVKLEPGEVVVFSWLKWPDRATADACFATMETDPAWKDMDMPFDGKRMMWGGFEVIFGG